LDGASTTNRKGDLRVDKNPIRQAQLNPGIAAFPRQGLAREDEASNLQSGSDYALSRLPRGGYEIMWRGKPAGRLLQDMMTATWVATLTEAAAQAQMPAPFVRFEHVFGSLPDALTWLGDPAMVRKG
jgi:hypothetical protein